MQEAKESKGDREKGGKKKRKWKRRSKWPAHHRVLDGMKAFGS